ncbi:MAG: DUF1003 domain-containing protein [Sphingomonadaceae bacterium]|nr:DUF1003 domain-containing protein [Sphingomonadaceae bacterium]
MADPFQFEMSETLRQNITRLSERRRRDHAEAPLSERMADRITCFVGSMRFVLLHAVLYGCWIAANIWPLPRIGRFDPSFVILAMEASVEAIFLSTFVLISQNRMASAADRRADLDLHINLLTEHELTRIAHLIERVARRLEIDITDPQFEEVKKDVQPETVLDALDSEPSSAD